MVRVKGDRMNAVKRLAIPLIPPAIVGWLRGWRVNRLVAQFKPYDVCHTYGAGPLHVHLSDPLARGWYDHDWAELPEIDVLRGSTLRQGARVFEIGAHQGVVALMLAREVGPSGQVVAVEANPHNCSAARMNRELNGLRQVEVVEAAVSDRNGVVVFNQGLNGQLDDGSGAGGRLTVPSVTLDELAKRFGMPDLVLLDIEGAECLTLVAGANVLASGADFCVEVHVGCGLETLGGSVERLLAFFPPDRFTLEARAEADATFRLFSPVDPIVRTRFFLLARAAQRRLEES